ncbi:hypothetical protein, partial [Actinoplanes sp. NPDC051411]|uniref:hypothetical protein n=1 Tax=Actinoplanes sp. NPDC051411 TaxID=3155522 RepID=UPI003447117C
APAPRAPARGPHRAAAGAVASSRTGSAVHLVDYEINSDGPASSAILTGAIGDFGTGETVKSDGSPDPEHTGQLKLTLKQGTFRVDIAALDARLVAAYRNFPADPRTCSGSVTVHAAAPVVTGAGTGAYKGLRGTFELTAVVDEVDAPPCDGTGAFIAQTIIISGSGAVAGV